MTNEEAIHCLDRIKWDFDHVLKEVAKNPGTCIEAGEAIRMAIAALRREGELEICLTMFVLDEDPSVMADEFFAYLKANGRDMYDPDGESAFEYIMRRSSKVLGREWEPEPLPSSTSQEQEPDE